MADPLRSLRRHAIAGLGAMALFIGLLGGWAGTTEIAGAVVAQGTVVPLEGSKRVQHPEGGVVSALSPAKSRLAFGSSSTRRNGSP